MINAAGALDGKRSSNTSIWLPGNKKEHRPRKMNGPVLFCFRWTRFRLRLREPALTTRHYVVFNEFR